MSEKRPLNGFFVCIYYLVNLVAGILHPVTIIGRENLPEHGALLCPNHNSNWDPVLVALKVPVNYRLHIMAKKELFENPFLRAVLTSIGTFPISRGEADLSGIRTALRILKEGGLLCIFPEGTRNKARKEPLLPLQEGVAMISLRAKAPIVPMWVDGGYAPWSRCVIGAGKPMDLGEYEGLRRVDAAAMKRLTAKMREDMLAVRADILHR